MRRKQDILERLTSCRDVITSRFGVKALSLFGSVVRDEAKPDSDLDIVVTFASAARFDQFMDLKFYLEDLLGAPVDLVTEKALRPPMRAIVQREAVRVA